MGYDLTIEPLGTTIAVADGQTILDAALRQGIYLPHACGHGLCGTCKIEVTEGEVDHGDANPFALMDFEREGGKSLACCATLLADTTIEAEIDEEPDAENIPVRDYPAIVARVENLTPTIKAYFLKLEQKLHFQAGQYVQLNLPGIGESRAFSIANSPQRVSASGEVELNIRLVEGGKGTNWIHQNLQIGSKITFSAPYGRFFVRKSDAAPLIFMAGGSGLSSPRSMILDLIDQGDQRPITLIYGQRNAAELYYDAELRALAAQYPNFTYVPALSEADGTGPGSGPGTGPGTGIAKGFVHDVAKAHFKDNFAGHKAYLCGPPLMIEACLGALMQGRLYERDIFTEKFITAADANTQRSPLFKRV
ncbi:MAG: 2Fe-2S iron-sulfur cluster binding domain-containing protein [Candidatus Symbiobacter sp.]|nr:2Fe-2S iron-sulfur cluster binding domain-containing protein [Candidatus Symbiobacter sp.]